MKKQNGFIATSLLYTFFLAFITLFIGVVTLHLQNRVYLNKLEDSSKNSIYIREIKSVYDDAQETGSGYPNVKITLTGTTQQISAYTDNTFTYNGKTCNFAKCETIYFDGTNYILEGCDATC